VRPIVCQACGSTTLKNLRAGVNRVREELEALVREAITEAGATSPSDMGKVMKLLTPRLQGRATGAQASQLVRQILQP
jgi:uncharacterized protein YqeY